MASRARGSEEMMSESAEGMKGSDMVYAVCNDCHTFKMGDKSLKNKEGFMTCDGCGQPLHQLKW